MQTEFTNVSVTTKANIYFDGKVVSHSLKLADGKKVTLGLIYPGQFRFNTDAPERMDVTAGSCRVKLATDKDWKTYTTDQSFHVPANSHFDIAVDSGIAEYICSFG